VTRITRRKDLSPSLVPLTEEEGFVLSRIDDDTTVDYLESLTGMDRATLESIVGRLADSGAIDIAMEARAPAAAPARAPSFGDWNVDDNFPPMSSDAPIPLPAVPAPEESLIELTPEEHGVFEEDEPEPASQQESDGETREEREHFEKTEKTFRELYGKKMANLPRDARVAMAQSLSGDDLLALTFDPDPAVVKAIVVNPNANLQHARLIAFNHHIAQGLEGLGQRPEFLRDAQVERKLLRNQNLPESMLRRVLGPKPLRMVYQTTIDREVPDLNRTRARSIMRARWQMSPSEEKADLVTRTEGRILTLLTGLTFDQRMTAILCGKTYASVIFVQNLARFAATPPVLLTHLLKQAFVKRQAHLRNLILQHPNVPSEAKRLR
jgi:hypothetical protein